MFKNKNSTHQIITQNICIKQQKFHTLDYNSTYLYSTTKTLFVNPGKFQTPDFTSKYLHSRTKKYFLLILENSRHNILTQNICIQEKKNLFVLLFQHYFKIFINPIRLLFLILKDYRDPILAFSNNIYPHLYEGSGLSHDNYIYF